METSSGQSLNLISQLPDDLLVKILSLLPTTKEVVATSVLSKQWRSLWKMVPNLKFNLDPGNDSDGFADSVGRTMLSLEVRYLQSLHLDVSLGEGENIYDFEEVFGIACGLHVRDLVLELKLVFPGIFAFPICLYNFQTLETLKLCGVNGSIGLGVPSHICLKSLRTLELEDLYYGGDESLVNLLAGCVSLENLFVTRKNYDGVETFTIAVPSLQELGISDSIAGSSGYMISSPSLKKLEIGAVECTMRSELTTINAPELVEAAIHSNDEYLLGESLTSVKRLSLGIQDIEVPAGSIFNQLEYLKLSTFHSLSWNPLTAMLDNSPNLQVLEINGFQEYDIELAWKQPEHVPQCLIHLKTLDWYIAGLTYGEEVAKYILSNAKCLENVILRINNDLPEEERLKVCHDIEGWCPDDCKFELIVAPIGELSDHEEPDTVTVAPFVDVFAALA